MGLTFLASMMGMAVAAPRDLAEGWNAATKKGQTQYTADIEHERPYNECFTPPCGARGNLGNWNLARGGSAAETVSRRRNQERPILSFLSKRLTYMTANDDYFILEKPLGSRILDEPEMSSVRKLIDDGAI